MRVTRQWFLVLCRCDADVDLPVAKICRLDFPNAGDRVSADHPNCVFVPRPDHRLQSAAVPLVASHRDGSTDPDLRANDGLDVFSGRMPRQFLECRGVASSSRQVDYGVKSLLGLRQSIDVS